MSKKLIAVAAAAALALSGLVATTSASALPVVADVAAGESYLSVTTTGTRAGAGTSGSPFTLQVPESGTIETTANVFSLSVSSTLKSRPVAITTSNGIKVLDELANTTNKYIASSGKDSLSLTTTSSGTLSFIAFPTSTATGVLTVSITATDGTVDTTQVFIKGLAGAAYAIKSVTPPTSVQPEGKGVFVAVLVDAFGNTVETGNLDVTVVGGGSSSFLDVVGGGSDITYSDTTERHEGTLTAGKVEGTIAIQAELAGTATDAQVKAFGTPVRNYFTTITTASLAGQVTALTAQVAALTAQLAESRPKARSVTKKRFNTLARKWNAAFPSQKVALKK
jgi:hypothetical protein